MIAAVRVVRVLLIIALACLAISFVIGIGTPGTGPIEKIVLLALIGGCVYAAAKVTTLTARVVYLLAQR
jgi:hypothetical protein